MEHAKAVEKRHIMRRRLLCICRKLGCPSSIRPLTIRAVPAIKTLSRADIPHAEIGCIRQRNAVFMRETDRRTNDRKFQAGGWKGGGGGALHLLELLRTPPPGRWLKRSGTSPKTHSLGKIMF